MFVFGRLAYRVSCGKVRDKCVSRVARLRKASFVVCCAWPAWAWPRLLILTKFLHWRCA